METWKNIRCNTFKTAPWVNSQHEEFKTSTHLGRPSWRCVASLQNKRRIFFHPKKVADWISWSTVTWISWSFYLEKILMINESTLGCWVPQPPLRMQSVNRWKGVDPKWTFEFAVPWRCANSLRHGDSCVVPHLNGRELGEGPPSAVWCDGTNSDITCYWQ